VDATGVPPPAPAVYVPVPVHEDAYSVQVAASPDAQQARRAVERLAGAGHPAFVLPALVGGAEVFRVRVGPFTSRQEARDALARLEREGHKGPWIVAPVTPSAAQRP
jgi:cell division septation protein DedD